MLVMVNSFTYPVNGLTPYKSQKINISSPKLERRHPLRDDAFCTVAEVIKGGKPKQIQIL